MISRAAAITLVCIAGWNASAAAPLRSPWDGHAVPLTDAPFACPALTAVTPDLTTDGFYRTDDPTHSIIDPQRMAAYKRSSDPVKEVGQTLVREADEFRRTGFRAEGRCVLAQMESLARQRSLTGRMSSGQAYYVQGWVAGAIAIAYLKVSATGLATAEQRRAIPAWLQQIGSATRDWYDGHAAKTHVSEGNNHLYWAGVELAAIGIAANDRKDFDWGMGTYENGVAQIRPDGTLPLEMERGSKALHYHLYALAPLVLLAEFGETNGLDLYAAHAGALHRLVKTSVRGLADPAVFVAGTGKQQEVPGTVSGDQIGWAPPYERRFPNATLARYIKAAPSLSVFYLGGLPPA